MGFEHDARHEVRLLLRVLLALEATTKTIDSCAPSESFRGHSQLMYVGHFDFLDFFPPPPTEMSPKNVHSANNVH